jgi:hypothetical protein
MEFSGWVFAASTYRDRCRLKEESLTSWLLCILIIRQPYNRYDARVEVTKVYGELDQDISNECNQ